MSDLAIRVENLSKLYRIGAGQEPYRTLRDTLATARPRSSVPGRLSPAGLRSSVPGRLSHAGASSGLQ